MRTFSSITGTLLLSTVLQIYGQQHYVSPWGSHTAPFASWDTAATNLNSAITAATTGATVFVTNGVYRLGSITAPGNLPARLAVTNNITVQSINGPRMTAIDGSPDSTSGTLGPEAIRGAYVSSGCLSGFTVRKGFTFAAGNSNDRTGGGIYATGGLLENLRIAGCISDLAGGGAWLQNCTVTNVSFYYNSSNEGAGTHVNQNVSMWQTSLNNPRKDWPVIVVTGTNAIELINGGGTENHAAGTDFGTGNLATNQTVDRIFTINNTGPRPLTIDDVFINGGNTNDFTISQMPAAQINHGGSSEMGLRFTSTQPGTRRSSVFILSNDPNDDPFVFFVYGLGTIPEIRILGTNGVRITNGTATVSAENGTLFDPSYVTRGLTQTNTLTITNAGSAVLNISALNVIDGNTNDFTIALNTPLSVQPCTTVELPIAFKPTATGMRSAWIDIHSDDTNSPCRFAVSGEGIEPWIQILGTNLSHIANGDMSPALNDGSDFGEAEYGAITHTFSVTNIGTGTLNLTGTTAVVISGTHAADFTVTQQPVTQLQPNETTAFTISFFPSSLNTSTAIVSIVNDDLYHSNDNYSFMIIGRGSTNSVFLDISAPLISVGSGTLDWGDFNNNGRLDLAVMGYDGSNPVTHVYYNLPDNSFSNANIELPGLQNGMLSWGDFDSDGWLDLAMTGSGTSGPATYIYRNYNGNILTNIQSALPGLRSSHLIWSDVNNNGRLDLVLCGIMTNETAITRIYHNNDGIFQNSGVSLPGVSAGLVSMIDFNKNGNHDLLIAGHTGSERIARLYFNNGYGNYTNYISLTGMSYAAADWADFDGDGLPDLAMCGYSANGSTTKIYRNNGNNGLEEISSELPDIWLGDVAWGDYNNNGNPELFITGTADSNQRIAGIYSYTNGIFSNTQSRLPAARLACGRWGDYDNDGDLDLAITGQTTNKYFTSVFRNLQPGHNSPPAAPTGLSVSNYGHQAVFSWNHATDDYTATNQLTYNLYVATEPFENDIATSHSATSGWRKVARPGHIGNRNTWTLRNMPTGQDLYWGVQAVDSSLKGGMFASGETFSNAPLSDLLITGIETYNQPFTILITITNQGTSATYQETLLAAWTDHPDTAQCGESGDAELMFPILGAGAGVEVTITNLTRPSTGISSTIRAYVNSNCELMEESLLNNQATYIYTAPDIETFSFNAVALQTNVYLRWTQPATAGYMTDQVRLNYTTNNYPATPLTGTLIYNGTNQLYIHNGTIQETTYYYSIWVSNDGDTWFKPVE